MAEVRESTASSHRLSDTSITVEIENPALAKGSEKEGSDVKNDDALDIKLNKTEKAGVLFVACISGLSVFLRYVTHFDSEAKILIDETYPNDPSEDSSCVVVSAKDSTGIGFASHLSLVSSDWCPNSDYILAKISLQGSENHLVHNSNLVALDAGAPFNKTSEGVLSWPYDTLEWGIWRVGSDRYFSNLVVRTAEGETDTDIDVLSLKIIEDSMDNAVLLSTCYNPTERVIAEYRQVNVGDCTTCVSNGCTFETVNQLNFPSAQCTENGLRFTMAQSDSPTEYLNIHCKISSDQYFERASLAVLSVIGAYQAARILTRRLILMAHGDCPSPQELVDSIPS